MKGYCHGRVVVSLVLDFGMRLYSSDQWMLFADKISKLNLLATLVLMEIT